MTHVLLPTAYILGGCAYILWCLMRFPVGGEDPVYDDFPRWAKVVWNLTTWIPALAFAVFSFVYWGLLK